MTRTLLAASLLTAASFAAPARAETDGTCTATITALPTVITTRGVYCLKEDLGTNIASGRAIDVHTNQVTIDCNGYRISGLGGGLGTTATGVYAAGRSLVTLRNCGVRGFKWGVYLTGDRALVEDNHIDQSTYQGIHVEGDGNLIRGNRLFDTGGSTAALGQVNGIYAEDATDIRDNIIEGVYPTASPNTSVYGIQLGGGVGVHVAGNLVRTLMPNGTGAAWGIYTSNGQKIFLDDNRVSLTTQVASSTGYRCNSSNGSLRNSSEWGFGSSYTGCYDDGGNVDH